MKTWHKWGLFVGSLLALASWIIVLTYWAKLPAIIPTHFGINGQPDAWNPKSLWWAFFLPGIQSLIAGGFVFLYYHPQYSDMPTTMWLMTMEKHKREHAFDLIRTMLVGTGLWVGVLFTYISYAMNASAMQEGVGMNSWLLLGLVGGMILWLVRWTVKVYIATKDAIKNSK